MAKFYHNNSYVYININKNEGIESCKRCINGRCLSKGCICSGVCSDFISINSDVSIDSPLKEKNIHTKKQTVDYSKSYTIKIYILQNLERKNIINLYISNKDYKIEDLIKIDVSDIIAVKLRNLKVGEQFAFEDKIYILKDKKQIAINKNYQE